MIGRQFFNRFNRHDTRFSKQLQTYKASIPSLFTYNGLMIISDGLEAKAGSLSAGLSRFLMASCWASSGMVGLIRATASIRRLDKSTSSKY
jgi:hypothetical protein